jgi:hypothetical protein
LATLSFSALYNLFEVEEMLAIIKECVLKLGISEINTVPMEKGVTLEVLRKDISMRITLRKEKISKEGSGFFQGQPKVKIKAVASSDNEKNLAKSIDEFKYCILIRAARGGG